MNEFIKPFQTETTKVKAIRERNNANLMMTLSISELKCYAAIKEYFAEILCPMSDKWKNYQPEGVKITAIRTTNKLQITPELLVEYRGCPKCATTTNTNSKARSLLKKLQKAEVLYKIAKDYYMINPLYIYCGSLIDDCWWEWCQLTGEEYDENVWNATRKVKDYSTGQISFDLTREQMALAKELSVHIEAHPNLEEERLKLEKEYYEQDLLNCRTNFDNRLHENKRRYERFGPEIACELMSAKSWNILQHSISISLED